MVDHEIPLRALLKLSLRKRSSDILYYALNFARIFDRFFWVWAQDEKLLPGIQASRSFLGSNDFESNLKRATEGWCWGFVYKTNVFRVISVDILFVTSIVQFDHGYLPFVNFEQKSFATALILVDFFFSF